MRFIESDGGRKAAGYTGDTRDCFARSVAIATGRSYQQVYDLINEAAKLERFSKNKVGKSSARLGVYKNTAMRVMNWLDWVWVPTMHVGSGCTVHLKEDELPSGDLVVRVSKHYTAVLDGVLHDTSDCSRGGTRCVYGYYKESQ